MTNPFENINNSPWILPQVRR